MDLLNHNLLHRKEQAYLHEWLRRPQRKPLVIRGARQVGKSTLVRQFAQEAGLALLEINFERNPEYLEAFAVKDPEQINSIISLLSGQKIIPGGTLLFLDEIQVAPQALVALRYFYEELPELHVLAAGSLLEFALEEAQFSIPVGRIEYFYLGPMQFDDFVRALGFEEVVNFLARFSIDEIKNKNIFNAIHDRCLQLLKQYWIIGGLPQAIASYVHTRDFSEVSRVHNSILATYRDDFNKYSQGKLKHRVQLVFDQIPRLIGQKFKYSHVHSDHRAAELEDALQQLCMAQVANRVVHSSANGVPLAAEARHKIFKVIFMDIGLLCSALKVNLIDLNQEDINLVNNGALAEQFIGQHLLYIGAPYESPALFYWLREAKGAAAELDYVLSFGQIVVPVEIKAGKTGTLKSLHQFLLEKNRHFGLRFNADKPSLLSEKAKLTQGGEVDYELLSLPLYAVTEAKRLFPFLLAPQA
jgi:uncharacterized protein